MKSWLSRAVINSVKRGRARENRITPWSGWMHATPTVEAERFQGPGDAYPGHWAESPPGWPPDPDEATRSSTRAQLREALQELPDRWRTVVTLRDVQGRSPVEVSRDLGISREDQRALLHRARAFLRERLAAFFAGEGNR